LYNKKYIDELFEANPTVYGFLKEAANPRMARNVMRVYLNEMTRMLNSDHRRIQPLEWALQMSCVETLKSIISIRSERLVKYSLIRTLWLLARGQEAEYPENLKDGFLLEMIQLFKGIQGKSGIYDQEDYPLFLNHKGRKAALLRSSQLDEMAVHCKKKIAKYQSGLNEEIIKSRRANRERILRYFKATEEDWNQHLWQIRHVIRDAKTLGQLIQLTPEEIEAIEKARAGKLPFGITPYYVSLMDFEPHRRRDHAVRSQVIPPLSYVKAMLAMRGDPSQSFDFMLEHDTSPIDLITRRYPAIAILKPYNTCSQICVYCQRNWEIEDVLYKGAMATKKKILAALEWLRRHPAIDEVLVTGGDPLVMNDDRIDFVLSELAALPHIERIRIGSRTPVVLPQRITDSLIERIRRHHRPGQREVALVTHFEHPYEVTPEAMEAVQKFKSSGISVYNQAVYTIENSRRFEMVALRRLLRLIGVDPYYTFNTKGKEETRAYRVPLARLQQEIKEEARLTPGLMRTDEPVYNVPRLGKNYIRAEQHHSLASILHDGRRVYEFHPWEKNLSMALSYVDTDVSIHEYLLEMERRGEDLADYRTIWYYF